MILSGPGDGSQPVLKEECNVTDEPKYVRVPVAVKLFGISRSQIWRWLHDGLLHRYKPNGKHAKLTLISVAELQALIEASAA